MIIYEDIGGMMPNQASGTVNGNPFYFRARWGHWSIAIVKPGHDPIGPGPAIRAKALLYGDHGKDQKAGWWKPEEFRPLVEKHLNAFMAGDPGPIQEDFFGSKSR